MAARLTTISNFKSFTSLIYIYIDWNSLTHIPTDEFPSTLDRLGVSGNLITSVDITNLPNLSTFYCQQNQLTSINISNNINLVHVLLNDNALTVDSVNNVLIQLDTNGLSPGICQINGGTNGAPTGAAITAVTNLTDKGWSVTTN